MCTASGCTVRRSESRTASLSSALYRSRSSPGYVAIASRRAVPTKSSNTLAMSTTNAAVCCRPGPASADALRRMSSASRSTAWYRRFILLGFHGGSGAPDGSRVTPSSFPLSSRSRLSTSGRTRGTWPMRSRAARRIRFSAMSSVNSS